MNWGRLVDLLLSCITWLMEIYVKMQSNQNAHKDAWIYSTRMLFKRGPIYAKSIDFSNYFSTCGCIVVYFCHLICLDKYFVNGLLKPSFLVHKIPNKNKHSYWKKYLDFLLKWSISSLEIMLKNKNLFKKVNMKLDLTSNTRPCKIFSENFPLLLILSD